MTKGSVFNKMILLTAVLSMYAIEHATAQFDSLTLDGYSRTYLLHLPSGYDGQANLPLVIAMHGGGGNSLNLQNQSGLSEKADDVQFAVVYPEGVPGGILNIRTWNAGWCCGFSENEDIDDLGFISTLIDTLATKYRIDTNRIYATGMSNGGFMSYRLACELSNRIAAIAPVAASMSLSACNPVRPVPIINFHSYQDFSVPYLGGMGDGLSDHHNTPQDSLLLAWSNMNECQLQTDTLTNNEQFLFTATTGCECGVEIHRYITSDGGHSWPGGNQTLIGDPTSTAINATDLLWSFLSRYSLPCNSSTATHTDKFEELQVFPNPTRDQVHISGIDATYTVSILDQLGRLMMVPNRRGSLDLSGLRTGIYVLQFRSDTNLAIRMISKHD